MSAPGGDGMSVTIVGKGSKPDSVSSTILSAFCRASSNDRPIPITSPTLFMELPIWKKPFTTSLYPLPW
ncbi:hypothetical protein E2C01_006984 [Portunus trituberculatus]|uniref:Uncharacterized protein n=1 Tax=Portunus trituberculatus TaxID=210409 RepID=A0A5B7CYT3_PORTR|nr:hypothetical protein [Portunus trituberculatus]